MNEITIDLSRLTAKQLVDLFCMINAMNAEADSTSRPFFCGESADVLDALVALVGQKQAFLDIASRPECKFSLDEIYDRVVVS